VRITVMCSLWKTSSKAALNLLSRSWIRRHIRSKEAGEAEVAHLLGYPGAGRVGRAACQVDAPALELDEEEHIEAAQRDRLDGEEITGEHAGSLLTKELAPLGPERLGAGPTPLASRSRLTMLGETRKPSLHSSPAIRG
jgi:hypothetical protein